MLRNIELVLASDSELLAWRKSHRALLERARAAPSSPEVQRELREAGASRVGVENGLTIVSIGGILDNVVGFLWAPEGRVPSISPSEYIWIEPAGDGWYLFKTT
jgi:hypothetical protein